jgi:hypothetical protein
VITDKAAAEQAARALEALRPHGNVIRAALDNYAEDMEAAAHKMWVAYQAGQTDPQVKAVQDSGFITNEGHRQAAERCEWNRAKAEEARRAIERAFYPDTNWDDD